MKKITLLSLIAFLFVGYSQAFAQTELGTWKVTSVDLKTPTPTTSPEGLKMEEDFKTLQGTFTFSKGGKCTIDVSAKSGDPIKNTNTYKIKDGKLIFGKPSMDLIFFEEAILKVNGNKATLTQPDMNGVSLTFNLEKTK